MSGNLEFLKMDVEKEATPEFEPVPVGEYVAVVTKANVKENQNGKGTHLSGQAQIIEGDFAKRVVFFNITLTNDNETAERIGRGQLAQLAKAVHVVDLRDTNDLLDKPLRIRVVMRKDDASRNDIKAFMPLDDAAHAPTRAESQPNSAPPRPAASVPGKKPWQK